MAQEPVVTGNATREKYELLRSFEDLENKALEAARQEQKLKNDLARLESGLTRVENSLSDHKSRSEESKKHTEELIKMFSTIRRTAGVDSFLAGERLIKSLRAERVGANLLNKINYANRVFLARHTSLSSLQSGIVRVRKQIKKHQDTLDRSKMEQIAALRDLEIQLTKFRTERSVRVQLAIERRHVHGDLLEEIRKMEVWRSSEKFSMRKGNMRWPIIPIRVVVPFGQPERSPDRSLTFVQRGIIAELRNDISKDGKSILAVHHGRVVVAESMTGYGNTIVIDHGEGYHGVYAGFDVIRTKVGAVVGTRDRIGFFRPTKQKPRFAFELLKDGAPIDPAKWFRNR
jgi:septal ring factor EnvC (AmiA/AmiB activator)